MSKFLDRMEQIGRGTQTPMGFGVARPEKVPGMALIALITSDHSTGVGAVAELAPEDEPEAVEPWDYTSGYLNRAKHMMPKIAAERPWTLKHDYLADRRDFRQRPVADSVLRFRTAPAASQEHPAREYEKIAAE